MNDLSKMSDTEARSIFQRIMEGWTATIQNQQRTSPNEIVSFPLDLTTARTRSNALKISIPFKSVLVEQATDLATLINIIPINNDSENGSIEMGLKDVYKSDMGFRECYVYWDAQPQKSVVLKFFVTSEIVNGRLVLDQVSDSRILNVAGLSIQDNVFNCVLLARVFGTNLPANTNAMTKVRCSNNPQYNESATGYFVVPSGFEFIITSIAKKITNPATAGDVESTVLGCAQIDTTTGNGDYLNTDPLLEKKFGKFAFTSSNYPYPLSVAETEYTSFACEVVQLSNNDSDLIVDAGKSIGAYIGAYVTNSLTFTFEADVMIVGYLRRI